MRLTFQVPVPDPLLNPNRRGPDFLKRQARRVAKQLMRAEVERVLADKALVPPKWARVRCTMSLFYLTQVWDEDNLIAATKPHRDVLQELGVIQNDRHLHFGEMQRVQVERMPRVEITIEPEQ